MSHRRLEEIPAIRLGERGYKEGHIRLNLSESLIPWPFDIIAKCRHAINNDDLIYYPANAEVELVALLGDRLKRGVNTRLILGNGSFELLNTLFQVFCLPQAKVLTPFPDFFIYPRLCKIYGSTLRQVKATDKLRLNIDDFIDAARRFTPDLIILSNPNNPTTGLIVHEDIERIASSTKAIVIVDEAYMHYAHDSAISLIDDHPNLIVLQTLSKIGLAGLRMGYLLCHEQLEEAIKKCIMPFPINGLSLKLARIILDDPRILAQRIDETIQQRSLLSTQIEAIEGFHVHPSHTNFLNIYHQNLSTKQLYQHLFEHDIIVTPSDIPGFLPGCIRVGVGRDWQHQQLIASLQQASI